MSLPTPSINEESAPFWEGTKEEQLLIKLCDDCDKHHWYPRTKCPFCHSLNTRWVTSSGRGVIYSHSTMRRTKVPFTLAYVTLEEGPTVMTNLVDCDSDELQIGQKVQVVYRSNDDGDNIPFFTPEF